MATLSEAPAEILLYIAENLDQSSLNACLRVCRRWHQLFTPQRWRLIHTFNWGNRAFRDQLRDHRHHVQRLVWCDVDRLRRQSSYAYSHAFSTFCSLAQLRWESRPDSLTDLQSLVNNQLDRLLRQLCEEEGLGEGEAGSWTGRYTRYDDRLQIWLIIHLLLAFKNLRRLVWITPVLASWLDNPQDWLQLRQAWLSIYSTVEELYVWNLDQPCYEPIVTLPPPSPLEFDASSSWSTSFNVDQHENILLESLKSHHKDCRFFPPGWEDAMFPNLKALFLGNVQMSPETFLRLIARCPNLRSILWPHFTKVPVPPESNVDPSLQVHHYSASEEFWNRIPAHFSNKIQHIWIGRQHPPILTEGIIRHMHCLRRLDLQQVVVTDNHLTLLVQLHPAIEEVDISFSPGLSSEVVWAFLCQARKLKRFEADRATLKIPQVLLDHVAKHSFATTANGSEGQKADMELPWWACRDLETLMIEFDIAMGSALGSRAMFAMLSRLPKLRYLRLANTNIVLSAAGGIRQLATLRRLKYFVLDTAVYDDLRREDVDWMLEHWPVLKWLHLSRRSIHQLAAIKGWAEECGRYDVVRLFSTIPD